MSQMATTPVSKSKLKLNRLGNKVHNDGQTTPLRKTFSNEQDEYSPGSYFQLTQEANDEIDVMWDWQSPNSNNRKKKRKKCLIPVQSPKHPIKRQSSNSNLESLERLRMELKALKEELAVPDDEKCLCVSPQQESEAKGEGNNIEFEENPCDTFDDLFNDSLDEQLVICSQQLENKLLMATVKKENTVLCRQQLENEQQLATVKQENSQKENFNSSEIDNLINKYTNHSNSRLKRTMSDCSIQPTVIRTLSGKLEVHRTKSFEMGKMTDNCKLTQDQIEEIERKRLEAKARLEAKKKGNVSCPLEEIEKKRLQAVAKLEAKRLQDIVEKKRQEALKKLQINRMRNAPQVKGCLSQKL